MLRLYWPFIILRSPLMAFTPPPDKIMFEIYKDVARNGNYQVIYFTELDDHNREAEINRAANGATHEYRRH